MRGLAAKILTLHSKGLTHAEIAAKLGCTKPNVSQTLKRHRKWDWTIAPIPDDHVSWVLDRARKEGMQPSMFAAKLLSELIAKELEDDGGE